MQRARPWIPFAVAVLVTFLRAPLLGAGFVSDDYVLLAGIEGRSPLGNGRFDLWSFYDGDPQRMATLIFDGAVPWWTAPTASHAFFRPLSSALLVAVHAVSGRDPTGYYAVVLALGAASIVVAGLVFDRVLPRPASVAALLLFALHVLHLGPARWIAAVHILLSTALGLVGWWAHLRWRRRGARLDLAASVAAFLLALLAGEAALCVLALVVAHDLLAMEGAVRHRARAVLVPAGLAGGYVALYLGFHRGAHAIGGYLDPAEGPGICAATLAQRATQQLPRFVTAAADAVPVGWGARGEGLVAAALAVSVAVLAALAWRLDRAALRTCAVWTAATTLAALPAMLGPTDRALYPATLGGSAALGSLVGAAWTIARGAGGSIAPVRAAALLGAGVAGLVDLAGGIAANFEGTRAMAAIASRQLGAVSALDLPDPASTDVVVVSADDQATGPWGGVLYAFATGRSVRSWQALAIDPEPHSVGRAADDTIDVAPAGDGGFRMGVYRDEKTSPMRVGDRVATRALTIEVLSVQGGRPTRIRVRSGGSLDAPSFCLVARGRDGLTRVRVPPAGRGGWLP